MKIKRTKAVNAFTNRNPVKAGFNQAFSRGTDLRKIISDGISFCRSHAVDVYVYRCEDGTFGYCEGSVPKGTEEIGEIAWVEGGRFYSTKVKDMSTYIGSSKQTEVKHSITAATDLGDINTQLEFLADKLKDIDFDIRFENSCWYMVYYPDAFGEIGIDIHNDTLDGNISVSVFETADEAIMRSVRWLDAVQFIFNGVEHCGKELISKDGITNINEVTAILNKYLGTNIGRIENWDGELMTDEPLDGQMYL